MKNEKEKWEKEGGARAPDFPDSSFFIFPRLVLMFVVFGVAILATVFLAPRLHRQKQTAPASAAPAASPAPAVAAAGSPEPAVPNSRSFQAAGDVRALAFRAEHGGLAASIRDALPDDLKDLATPLADRLNRALRWQGESTKELRRNELFKIVFNPNARAERAPLYGFWRERGKDGKPQFYIYYPQAQRAPSPFYDEQGVCIAETIDRPPLDAANMEKASIDNLGAGGLYFAVPRGTLVTMPFPGRVLRTNWDMPALGRSVEVRYLDSDAVAWFAHLDAVAEKAHEGELLSTGDPVGEAGESGRAPRPGFLYRTFHQEGDGPLRPFPPLDLHETKRLELPPAERLNFIAIRDKIEKLLASVDAE